MGRVRIRSYRKKMLECGKREIPIGSGQQIVGLQIVRMQLDPTAQIGRGSFEILAIKTIEATVAQVRRTGMSCIGGEIFPGGKRCFVAAQSSMSERESEVSSSTRRGRLQCGQARAKLLLRAGR